MIRVFKDYGAVPEALNRLSCKRKIKKAIESQSGKVYNGYHYKDRNVKDKLNSIYNDKCAYCESKIEHAATLQVEHYRPKDGLAEDATHKGYYWLGCEWSNLLIACPKCNGKGAKGTKFPIIGARVYSCIVFGDLSNLNSFRRARLIAHSYGLLVEKPYLLNPELDNPINHLTFDSNGKIKGKTQRGIKTIEICKLDRDLLYKERQKVRDDLLSDIKVAIEGALTEKYNAKAFQFTLKTIFDKLSKRTLASAEYSLWGNHCYDNFEQCFVQNLRAPFQEAIRCAFNAYTKNEL